MQPRWYQSESVDAVFSYLRAGPTGSPVVVLPTGAGKSIVLAEIARRVVKDYGRRVLIVAHRKELLQQNAEKVRALMPDMDVGIFSAGLNSRDTDHDVICCGIQSTYDKAHLLGSRHIVLIDEVHLVPSSGEGMYRTFTQTLQQLNPGIRFVGLTATPFRTSEGRLTGRDKLFSKIVYTAPIGRLISEGFLAHVTNTVAASTIDTSKLKVRGGEFVSTEVESLFNQDATVTAACRELVELSYGRESILVFCSGVNHASHVARIIEKMTGDEVGIVTGQSNSLERAGVLLRFKERRLKWVVNVDVLTTGFDAPCIDCVAVLRATMSPGLFAQMVGRALRTHPEKADGLILDFGENLKRHGPIDSPTFGMESQKRGDGVPGEAPVKVCPACGAEQYAGSRDCECGFVFPVKESRHSETSEQEAALLAAQQKPQQFYVTKVTWQFHRKKQAGDEAPPTLRVNYECEIEEQIPESGVIEFGDGALKNLCPKCKETDAIKWKLRPDTPHFAEARCNACGHFLKWLSKSHEIFRQFCGGNLSHEVISEWVCLQHEGFARTKALVWWQAHSLAPAPSTIREAISLLDRGAVAMPSHIVAKKEGHFWRIISQTIDEKPEYWQDEAEEELQTVGANGFEEAEVPF